MYCGPSKSVLEDSTKIQVQTGFNEDTIVNNYMLCMFDQLKCAHKFNLIVQFSLLVIASSPNHILSEHSDKT